MKWNSTPTPPDWKPSLRQAMASAFGKCKDRTEEAYELSLWDRD
jgi:hypothetical protein